MNATDIYDEYFSALVAGDFHRCHIIVSDLITSGIEARDLYTDFFQASLYQVGDYWADERLCVSNEHLVSQMTYRLMDIAYQHFVSHIGGTRKIVMTTCSDEYHHIGARIVCDFLELHNWVAYYLGPSVPETDLIVYINQVKPEAVGLSLTMTDRAPELISAIHAISAEFPAVTILIGGQAIPKLSPSDRDQLAPAHYLPDLAAVEEFSLAPAPSA